MIVFVLAFFLRPPSRAMPAKKKQLNLPQTKIDFTPPQVLRSPIFWVMYLVFVMVAAGGLMTAAQIAPIAHDFKIADEPVSMLGFQMAALTFAISLDRIFDGFGRPFFGWVSDTIGRENTMFIAFATAALMLLTLSIYGHIPVVFVLATAVYFGVFGEIYSLFPATSGDTFGAKYATTNNGMLYTAKGTAALLVPLASIVAASYGWQAVFVIAVGAERHRGAAGALFVIKPMRRAFILGNEARGRRQARTSAKRPERRPISIEEAHFGAPLFLPRSGIQNTTDVCRPMPLSRAPVRCQNVNNTAAFLDSARFVETALTIGIMYTKISFDHDDLRQTQRRLR